ncbi:beta-1,3-galactosyltransferase 5-like [Haliotis rufescens]|uniref:beta-1,3-galactosyltransferase 5-like n=1 Tax=Haliotis rufescens TaxID=6454 RepID=UPI00201EF79A|nr:beta-1,3-galactosyltransferase 5-like [Haliotis rufescens]
MNVGTKSVFICLVLIQACVSIVIYIFGLHTVKNKTISDTYRYREERDWKKIYYQEINDTNVNRHRLTRGDTDARLSVVLENKLLCKGVSQVDLLFVVHSAGGNHDRRGVFRTVLKGSNYKNYTIHLLFLLGLTRYDAKLQDRINQEFNQYGDIIQGQFLDSYRNLTYKAVMGLKWISHNCRNVKYVVKTDDDVFVDLDNFFPYIYHDIPLTNCILCRVLYEHDAVKVNRRGKWSVQKYQFRHYDYFPVDYCSGFAVVMPGSVIPALYKATRLVPFFWVDDVFLFGMARSFLANLKNLNPELYKLNGRTLLNCFNEDDKCKVVFSPVYSNLILPMWQRRQEYLRHRSAS